MVGGLDAAGTGRGWPARSSAEATRDCRGNRLNRRLSSTAQFDFFSAVCRNQLGGWPRRAPDGPAEPRADGRAGPRQDPRSRTVADGLHPRDAPRGDVPTDVLRGIVTLRASPRLERDPSHGALTADGGLPLVPAACCAPEDLPRGWIRGGSGETASVIAAFKPALGHSPDADNVVIPGNDESYCEFCRLPAPLIWMSGCI